MERFKIGQWVINLKGDKERIGYIVRKNTHSARIIDTQTQRAYYVSYIYLQNHDKINLGKSEINALIDIALDVRDFAWAKELNEMKNKI